MFDKIEKVVHGFLKAALIIILLGLTFGMPLIGGICILATIVIYYSITNSTNKYNFYAKHSSPSLDSNNTSTSYSYSGSANEYQVVIDATKSLESMLRKIGANGKGLHEKTSSVDLLLSPELSKLLRKIATIRNKLIHEEGFSLPDRQLLEFKTSVEEASEMLELIDPVPSYASEIYECTKCSSEGIPLITSRLNLPVYASCENCGERLRNF